MRIAQVAPLYESVPPKTYGGTERVVSYLTEELVRQGHEVTLFATGDSTTTAHLISHFSPPLWAQENGLSPEVLLSHHAMMIEQVIRHTSEFDVLHFHAGYLHAPAMRRQETPHVTTFHAPMNIPELFPVYREFSDIPVVSISDSQRRPVPWLNWQGTVHHGLPPDLYAFHGQPGGYLAFLGRTSPEKGMDRAVEIARRAGMKIKIAAKIDRDGHVKERYFQQVIRPLLEDPVVEFLGEIGDDEKDDFLGNAFALLTPINWPEPFGLVMIEAMACGTPVIAYNRGSVPEIIDDGVTGAVVNDIDEAVAAVDAVSRLSRARCRQVFEKRFTTTHMAHKYLSIYNRILASMPEKVLAR